MFKSILIVKVVVFNCRDWLLFISNHSLLLFFSLYYTRYDCIFVFVNLHTCILFRVSYFFIQVRLIMLRRYTILSSCLLWKLYTHIFRFHIDRALRYFIDYFLINCIIDLKCDFAILIIFLRSVFFQ